MSSQTPTTSRKCDSSHIEGSSREENAEIPNKQDCQSLDVKKREQSEWKIADQREEHRVSGKEYSMSLNQAQAEKQSENLIWKDALKIIQSLQIQKLNKQGFNKTQKQALLLYQPKQPNLWQQIECEGQQISINQEEKYQLKIQRIQEKRERKQLEQQSSSSANQPEDHSESSSHSFSQNELNNYTENSQRTVTTQAQQDSNSRPFLYQIQESGIISQPIYEQQNKNTGLIIEVAIKNLSEEISSEESNSNSSSSRQSSSTDSSSSFQDSPSESTTTMSFRTQRLATVIEHPEESVGSNVDVFDK